jgi:hypothetical protein
MLNVVAWALPQAERRTPPEPKPVRSLTDEQKQILKDRELLENLDLLRDFEKIRFLEFFREAKPAANPQTPAGEPSGKDNGKEKNRKS